MATEKQGDNAKLDRAATIGECDPELQGPYIIHGTPLIYYVDLEAVGYSTSETRRYREVGIFWVTKGEVLSASVEPGADRRNIFIPISVDNVPGHMIKENLVYFDKNDR